MYGFGIGRIHCKFSLQEHMFILAFKDVAMARGERSKMKIIIQSLIKNIGHTTIIF